jgi:two-component system nitrate/nitrite response regulator NarL
VGGHVPKQILIIDDNPQIRELVRCFVNSLHGFNICGEAFDGVDGIEKAVGLRPDLIVLDFQMPRLNGIETARVLRENLPDVPIVLFTIHRNAILESNFANLGIRAVLSKMDGIRHLSNELHRLLPDE